MKRCFFVAIALLCSLVATAQNKTTEAEKAYEAGEFNHAVSLYNEILSTGKHSAELYYNLGNAYFKSDMIGQAILNYSRALRLDPSMDDARYNLEVTSARTVDKIEAVPEFFVVSYLSSLRDMVSGNTWAVLSIVFLVVALGGVVLWLVMSSLSLRKVGFSLGMVFMVLAITAFCCSLVSYNELKASSQAVVVNTAAPVTSSPAAESKDLFMLHEGTVVGVLESADGWAQIELSNGEKGWIESHSIEVI